MVKSSLTMAMWRLVILAPLTPVFFSVILTDLIMFILLVGTDLYQIGLHRVGSVWAVPGFERNRSPMLVKLIRSSGAPEEGIHRDTSNSTCSTLEEVLSNIVSTFALSHTSLFISLLSPKLSQVRLQHQSHL